MGLRLRPASSIHLLSLISNAQRWPSTMFGTHDDQGHSPPLHDSGFRVQNLRVWCCLAPDQPGAVWSGDIWLTFRSTPPSSCQSTPAVAQAYPASPTRQCPPLCHEPSVRLPDFERQQPRRAMQVGDSQTASAAAEGSASRRLASSFRQEALLSPHLLQSRLRTSPLPSIARQRPSLLQRLPPGKRATSNLHRKSRVSARVFCSSSSICEKPQVPNVLVSFSTSCTTWWKYPPLSPSSTALNKITATPSMTRLSTPRSDLNRKSFSSSVRLSESQGARAT